MKSIQRPPSPAGSNVSMGSVSEGTPTLTSSYSMFEEPPPPASSLLVAPEVSDGVRFKNTQHVAFKGSSEDADTYFRVADTALNRITDLLNWTISKSRPILSSHADLLCTSLPSLIRNLSDLGVLKDYASRDELGICSTELGTVVSDLVTIPSIAAFTPAPENVKTTHETRTPPVPPTPKRKKNKSKVKASAPPPVPPRPPCAPMCAFPTQTCCSKRGYGYVMGSHYQQTENWPATEGSPSLGQDGQDLPCHHHNCPTTSVFHCYRLSSSHSF